MTAEEAVQFVSDPKVKNLFAGIQVLRTIVQLQVTNVETAVASESEEFTMDF
jgi:hypothetical protein